MSNQYPRLLEPIHIDGVSLSNRVIMGSMHTGLEEEGKELQKLASFFEERARGEVGLIITGGVAPHWRGWVAPFSAQMTRKSDVKKHLCVTEAVHKYDTKIVMQILHAGRYAYHPFSVAPSRIKAPINPFKPFAPSTRGVKAIVQQFVRSAQLAQEAGYDGVEVMGSEGYLINQFIAKRTNHRRDIYGGSYENRMRFALEILDGIRKACPDQFLIVYRLSMLDLVDQGSTWDEVVELAKRVESTGVSIINTGIGWHEARVPTIATCVPRAGFSWVTSKLKKEIKTPLAAVNRINMPDIAENILASGEADFVTMARPFLADAEFVKKAKQGQSHLINTCIACNQACLDHVFKKKRASCLVNPVACHEDEVDLSPVKTNKSVAVVGAGPAGLSAACYAARRGFKVTLFESKAEIGGQFNLAKVIPGKEEFTETIRYFLEELKRLNVDVKYNTEVTPQSLIETKQFSHVAWASGVKPRVLSVPGINASNVFRYDEAIRNVDQLGDRVVIIGAGGIGIDTASLLMTDAKAPPSLDNEVFQSFWGIQNDVSNPGGLDKTEVAHSKSARQVTVLYRSKGKPGTGLGKTTGWIHRTALKKEGVKFVGGVEYDSIQSDGVHYRVDEKDFVEPCDSVIICAGQEPELTHWNEPSWEIPVSLIGGVRDARGIDAKRAIREGMQWAVNLSEA